MGASRTGGEFTGGHMLAAVLGFFGVVIAVNVGMAIVASTSWTGLVVTNSYVASQEFEEKRLAHEAQAAAGWAPELSYAAGVIQLRVGDGAGKAVDLGTVSILLNRPVGGHDDQQIDLIRTGDGGYEGTAQLAAGVWDATVTAPATPLGSFELRTRLRIAGTTP